MTLSPLQGRLLPAALALTVALGFADWAFLLPEDLFDAFLGIAIAGGSAIVAQLPFLFPYCPARFVA